MKYVAVVIAVLACVFIGLRAPASASDPQYITHDGEYIGQSIVVDNDEDIQGNVTVIGGDADVKGRIDGDITVVGGQLIREPGSVITGRPTVIGGGNWASTVPWVPTVDQARQNAKMMGLLAYSAVVVLMFLIFPVRVRAALDRVEHHPGLSAATGVLALIASVPIAVLLFISFVGWPLLTVEFVAYVAGVLIGQAALGILIGRRLFELVRPHGTPSPLSALILGLVVISAAEILPVVGWMVTALVWLVGLGAAVLAFVRETSFMSTVAPAAAPAGAPGPRPPIGGPPMTAA